MKTKTPSEVYNLPVIGKIWCKLVGTSNGMPLNLGVDEYDVIKIIENDDSSSTYVCNAWNSPGVAQIVPSFCVIKFEER